MRTGRAPAFRVLTRAMLLRRVGIGLLVLAAVGCAALAIGPHIISPLEFFSGLGGDASGSNHTVIFDLRLPRIILAVSVGAALAFTGTVFQALLRNPLAEPYILGISNGCVIGAMLGIVLGVSPFLHPVLSFVGGAVAVLAVLAIGRDSFGLRSESMLLGGTMVAAIGAAVIFLLLHIVGPNLRTAVQWMLGDLSSTQKGLGYASGILFLLLLVASFFCGRALNALAMGDEEAASLGVNVVRARAIAYMAASFIVGLTVALCGAVGFVGLVVPHILRRIVGPDHRGLLPLAVIGGGVFLLICDTVARSILPAIDSSATELPVGAITAMIGAPLFIYLLRRGAAQGQ
ncbi:MAG: iron ABC transporter permease [Bacteroidetes bacterium]|nr:iron ABC transporter permease [Bacteroidota bacterium]